MSPLNWIMAGLLKVRANRAAGNPTTPLPPLVPPRPVKEPASEATDGVEWLLVEAPGIFGEGVLTARGRTKSEARSRLKRRLNLKRLPPGTRLTRCG